ncbi:MAG: proline racemase family protein [Shinella zoogloeoides]|uniref:proline racemase family protein n=1 Tax=Shinella zoogloeoides TaxID=352475 RepID=UPI003C71B902
MKLKVVDAHSSGAPCRTVIGGLEDLGIVGSTMLEKKKYIEQNHDWLRTSLLQEPRGFPAVNADLVLPPCNPDADVGLVIINQRPIYPVMSGGNILCFTAAILHAGVVPIDNDNPVTIVRVDTPAGLVIAKAACRDGLVESVSVENVPSYATHLDTELHVPGIGNLTVDVAYGGMFYLIVSAKQLGLKLVPENAADICEIGERIRAAAVTAIKVDNPASTGMSVVDAVMIYDEPYSPENHGRSAVVMPMLPGAPTFATGANALIDRCPCGTGTSAQIAALHAKGKLRVGEDFRQESIIDEVYIARPVREIEVNGKPGIVPELVGTAHVIAESVIHISERDPLRHGFKVGDMWPGRVPSSPPTFGANG